MKVFISYSRTDRDQAIAGLLSQLLRARGVLVYFDEGQTRGVRITKLVGNDLRDCDAMIVLLTDQSESSPWVNQEIGFASALYKPVLPVLISNNIPTTGWLTGVHTVEVNNWFRENIADGIIDDLSDLKEKSGEPPPSIIVGEVERTRIIIEKIKDFRRSIKKYSGKTINLYERSALSIFSVGSKTAPSYPPHYWEKLVEQRAEMEELLRHERVKLWLHMWPESRAYNSKARKQRLSDVKSWLENYPDDGRVRVKIKRHPGPNMFAIEGESAFEGLRPAPGNEYTYTLVWRPPSRKLSACFDKIANGAWLRPADAAKALRKQEKKVKQ